jgi:ribonuclease P protein component
MLKKKYRLKEKDLKKVLHKWKPFFSYGLVLNYSKNKIPYNRFGVVIWWKSVDCNVERNYFRRVFYDEIRNYDFNNENKTEFLDFVFVVKKQTKLKKEEVKIFKKDIAFLLKKVII